MTTARSVQWAIRRALLFAAVASGVLPGRAAAQQPDRFLAKEDILLYGIGLKVDPAQQTVPKDIATIVSTYLQAPQLPDNVPPFGADAEVVATLRGPSFQQPLELHAKPNSPFNIPPLGVAGTHTLDDIRLISNGQVLLRGTPESVRLDVIDKLLVTQVTTRALTAQEIRDKGIVFDKSNFQAYNFAAAFAIQDNPININFTVVLPTVQGAADVSLNPVAVPTVPTPTVPSLQTIIPDTLKLQTQIPNLQVVGFTLKVPDIQGQNFVVPPIPGVIVIPGDIGFLDQYFSVMLMVSNAAPTGSNLVVTDLHAQIVLPPGNDGVVGTPDDPLAMANTTNGPNSSDQPIVQLGADGRRGTSDDINRLGPQETGSAEYLVEGRREGSHTVEMAITGTLLGLPIGPVTVTGRAAGAVLVRNPKFTLTFTHPQVVTAGEAYTLDVTVTNTSDSPANFVSVSLHGQNISGATLVGDSTKSIDSVPPGDSSTVSFDLVSKVTGQVTAATLDSDQNIAGRFELKTSVGELGVPLSPDSLVLPQEANALPQSLRDAAIGMLGKAYAVATAPAAALPPDVKRFSRQIVIDSAVSVAEAGLRVTLHEPIPDSALQLAMDFDGSDYARLPVLDPKPDDLAFAQTDRNGFDDLRRRSVRGDVFAQAVGDLLADSVGALGPSAFHTQMAEKVAYRPGHISVLVAGAGQLPFDVKLIDPTGRQLGGIDATGKVVKQIPFSDLIPLGTAATLALITTPDQGDFTIELDPRAGAAGPATLSIVVPAADGTLRHIIFDNVTADTLPTPTFASTDPYRLHVTIGGSGNGGAALAASTDAPIVGPPPSILGIVQQAQADVLKCDASDKTGIPAGRVVAVLFSAEVTADSAQDKARPEDITNYSSTGNRVVGVALQPGGRIVYLALRDPVGTWMPADLTISGVADVHGRTMPAQTAPVETTVTNGGVVTGRVIQADGTPVANADLRLFYLLECDDVPSWVGISAKPADDSGHYSWNFVGDSLPDRIVAIDPGTEEFRDVRFNIQRDGQRLTVDIVLLGRGTLQGRTLAEDGTPLRDSAVRVTSLTDQSQYGATTDADGKFTIGRIPVGSILIEAVNVAAKAKTFIAQAIPSAGSTTVADLVLLAVDQTQVTIKRGTITGFALRADGVTPVKGVPVIAWYQSDSQPGIPCPGDPTPPECAVAVVNTDASGAYEMDAVVAGTLRLQTFDQTSFAQGEARVVLPADGAITANVLLSGGIGTVTGSVLDANGQAVPNARVGGGLSIVTTDANGHFTLTDVPTGRRDIVAVSDALGASGTVTVDLLQAGETVGATIVLQSVGSVSGRVFEADGSTPVSGIKVYVFKKQAKNVVVVGAATTDANGGYRIDKIAIGDYQVSAFRSDFSDGNIRPVALRFFQQVFRADVVFRGGGGKVTGVALDADGQTPLKAGVSISGDQLVIAGGMVGVAFEYVANYKITQTDFTTGRYSFTGLWVGDVTVSAAGQFSPDPVSLGAKIPSPNATVQLDIRLQATSSITGTVFQSDGITPVGPNVLVKFHSDEVKVICSQSSLGEDQCQSIPQGVQEENVVTDKDGHFLVPVVNAGVYTISVEDPATGKIGLSHGSVRPGQEGHITVRLLGMGEVTVHVLGSDSTTPIPSARVTLQQTDYPTKTMTVTTDANGVTVFSGGDALTEGSFAVSATDTRNGFTGRASGKVSVDGEHVTVNVYLFDAWGYVTGHVFRSDGLTPVPNADLVISNAAGPLAFGITDGDGAYTSDYIPVGPVTVDTFEAATARVGSSTGRIDFAQQSISIDVNENALGLVKGTVLEGGSLAPLKGWEVTLAQTLPSGRPQPTLRTTTSIDGSYSFPGASQGSLVLRVSRDGVNGSATATAQISREGQVVEVPLVVDIIRPLSGSVTGMVFNGDGTPGANALVDVCPGGNCDAAITVTADGNGTFNAANIPLGRFLVNARSQVSTDSGSAVGEITFDGQVAGITVALKGLSTITGHVYNADGSPAEGAKLELTGIPSSGCAGTCVQFALPGTAAFTFVDVAASSFTIVATGAATDARGVVGDRLNPGETKTVDIRLAPFGSLAGRVLLPGGAPAANIVGELVISGRHLYVQSGADGTYTFPATPLDTYTLTLQDPIGPGIAVRTGTVTGAITLPDTVLDTAPPAVTGVSPAPGAIGVARNASVQIVFSEPIDPGSVTHDHVTVSNGAALVDGTLQTAVGDTAIVFTPLSLLRDQTQFTIRVSGVTDRVGKLLPAPYVTSFTTVDITPPHATSIDPAPGTSGVAIESPVRVAYSESIDTAKFRGPPIAVSKNGAPVDGRIDYAFANTVVIFTPGRPFDDSATYQVDRLAATDLAGNVETAPASFNFSTTDHTPPTLAALTGPPSVIENANATITADVGTSSDVAVVDFFINDVFSYSARTAPFAMTFRAIPTFGKPGDQIRISALATDTSGNRSVTPAQTTVTVTADQPPVVTVNATTPTGVLTAHNNDRVVVTVHATDDVGLAVVGYKAQTGKPQDAASDTISPTVSDRTDTFAFHVPADAVPGSTIEIDASASDTKGQITAAAPIQLVVLDSIPPTVTITGATTGSKVNPGQQTTVAVSAHDSGGIASITLTATGVTQFAQTRTVDPPQTAAITSFTFPIPPNARAGDSVTIIATAVDKAGNVGTSANVVLPVSDGTAPTITLRTSTGVNDIGEGQTVTLIAEANDDVAVANIDLTGVGAFAVAQSHPFSPALASGSANFSFIVPTGLPDGATVALQARATDLSGNISAPALLTLTIHPVQDVTLPASVLIKAGESATVTVQLPAGAATDLRVDFSTDDADVATVTPSVSFAAGETSKTFTASGQSSGAAQITASIRGVPRASMTAAVRGGIVTGVVLDQTLQPVSGAQITVTSGVQLATVTDADGGFAVEGAIGPGVAVQATDPNTQLYGYATGSMNRQNGYARINVIVTTAASLSGTVFQSDGSTPAGDGVRVDIYQSNDMSAPRATAFTDSSSTFSFPFVQLGDYVLDATGKHGERARATVRLATSAEQRTQPLSFLGQGTVVGRVLDGLGAPVNGAAVTFRAFSIFGASAPVQTTTGPDGAYRFDGVLVGQFWIDALGPIAGQAGTTAGQIALAGDTVTADIHLAGYGSLHGTVYRADHQTTVSGANVAANGRFTTTDAQGQYSFAIMPLGSITVSVDDPGAHGKGSATTTLTTAGQSQTLDIFLLPQGSVAVTVVDANGGVVPGANVYVSAVAAAASDSQYQRANDAGVAVFDHVLAGTFSVDANNGVLAGAVRGVPLAAGQVQSVTVRLQPTASIAGLVLDADGQTPVTGGSVSDGYTTIAIAADGTFRFDGLALNSYSLYVYDSLSRLRAFTKTPIALTRNGQVATANLTFVGLGHVTGRVTYASNGQSAANFFVNVQSLNHDFGVVRGAPTNAAGIYTVDDIPVGPFTVTTGDLSQQLLGEGDGALVHDGDTVEVNIALQNNAITLPASRHDANNFNYDIQPDGTVSTGLSPFAGAFALEVIGGGVPQSFIGGEIPTDEQNGRQIVTRQNGIAGLDVTRKIFVPKTGYFARLLEILRNPTSDPITVDVQVSSGIVDALAVRSTSSGDAQLSVADPSAPDRWVVLDDNVDGDPQVSGGQPATAFVFDGDGASVHASTAGVVGAQPRQVQIGWRQITIPAGGTVALMHFAAQETTRLAAATAAGRLLALAPEALDGLTADELAAIANFLVPQDGRSSVAPLPSLGGTINGRVFEADGATVTAPAQVSFQSSNVLFGRTYHVTSSGAGLFTFAASFDNDGQALPVPIDGFTLQARHPMTGAFSPIVTAAFDPQLATVFDDIVFSNTAMLSGTVLRDNGIAVSGGSLAIHRNSPPLDISIGIGGDARYHASGLLAGTYLLTASVPHSQGTALVGTTTVTVTAGAIVTADVTIQATGAIAGTVTAASGSPAAAVRVDISAPGFARTTTTDTGGVFLFSDVPEGAFTVRAYQPATQLPVSVSAAVVRGQTTQAPLQFPPVGRLDVQVNSTSGAGVAGAQLQLQESVRGSDFRVIGLADGGGHFTLSGLSAGDFAVRALNPVNTRIFATASGTLTSDGATAAVVVTLPVAGTVTGTVTDQNGAAVSGIGVTVRSTNPTFGGFQSTVTDTNGVYAIGGVPQGAFTATVQDFSRQLFGETTSSVDTDGQTVTADISLINNAIQLPTDRYDANQSWYRVEVDGRVNGATSWAFGYYWVPTDGASQLEIVSGGASTAFTGASVGTTEQNGRTIVLRQSSLAGLDVTRKVFVPKDGYFARYVELLTNPTNAPITIDLRVHSTLTGDYSNRTSLIATSSGDQTLAVGDPSTADRWAVFDDNDADPFITGSRPSTAFVFDGAGAAAHVASAAMTGDPASEQTLTYEWNAITVPAGQTVGVMHYVVQEISRAGARFAADRLSQLSPEAIDGLLPQDVAAIQNFAVPSSGLSTLAPIGPLTASVTGRTLANDDTTLVPNTRMTFRSLHPLFGRTWGLYSDASGQFTVKGHLDDGNTSMAVPIAPFTLHAWHPQTNIELDQPGDFTGTFTGNLGVALGRATANTVYDYYGYYTPDHAIDNDPNSVWIAGQPLAYSAQPPRLDITFPVDVTVSHVTAHTTYLQTARVELVDAAGQVIAAADNVDASSNTLDVAIAGTGVRQVRITDLADTYNIYVYEVQVAGTAPSSAGSATQDVVFANSGMIAATVHRHTGAPVTDGSITVSGGNTNVYAGIGSSGGYTFTGIPTGTYTLSAQAYHPQGDALTGTATVAVVNGATSTIDVPIQPTGAVQGTVHRGDGTPSAGSSLTLQWTSCCFSRSTTTDANGHFVFTDVPLYAFTLHAYEPYTGVNTDAPVSVASVDQVVTQDMTLVALGTVSVHVSYARGVGAQSSTVYINEARRGYFRWAGVTDGNGDVTISNVTQGAFTVRATHPLNGSFYAEVPGQIVHDGDVMPIAVTLPPVGSINGTVTYPDGTAVPYPNVVAIAPDGTQYGVYDYDGSGHYIINALPAQVPLKIRAWWPYPHYNFYAELPVTIAADNDSDTVDLRLPGFAHLSVHVVQSDGVTPYANLAVQTTDDFRQYWQSRGSTNATGDLTLQRYYYDTTPEDFAEGGVVIRLLDPNTGVALLDTPVTIAFSEINTTKNVAIRLNVNAGSISGHVYAADGATAIGGGFIELFNAADMQRMTYTWADGSGAYAFNNVLPGQQGFIVRAHAPWDSSLFVDVPGVFATAGQTVTINPQLAVIPGSVAGTVTAGNPPQPMAQAPISIQAAGSHAYLASATTDANGHYQTPTFYSGPAGFVVFANDPAYVYSAQQAATFTSAGQTVTVDLNFPLVSATFTGTVHAADGVTPLPDAAVSLSDQSGDQVGYTYVGATGAYAFGPLFIDPAGYTVAASFDERSAFVTGGLIAPGASLVNDLTLPVSVAHGRVLFTDGTGVPNPNVVAVDAFGVTHYASSTDASGGYVIFDVPVGDITVTAQDGASGLSASAAGTLVDIAVAVTIDVHLPPTGSIHGVVTDASGNAMSGVQVALVSANLAFDRYVSTDNTGTYAFDHVPAGAAYVQTAFWDGSGYRYVAASGSVTQDQTLTLNLAWDGGGTVSGSLTHADGTSPASASVSIQAFGGSGREGTYSSSQSVTNTFSFSSVPAGPVHVVVRDGANSNLIGVADGIVTTGGLLTLNVQLGNGVPSGTNLDGADGFRYDVDGSGVLGDGGTVDRHLNDAYDGADYVTLNNISFPYLDAARIDPDHRQVTLGPTGPNGLLLTRKIFVPAAGGFARYLEIVTNPTVTPLKAVVKVTGNLGSDSSTRVVVDAASTGNTFSITDQNGFCCDPLLGHVYQGSGAVVVPVSNLISGPNGNDNFSFTYTTTVPAGGTVVFMHFELQREMADSAGARAQAQALADLTDASALVDMTAAELAAVVNFVVPNTGVQQ